MLARFLARSRFAWLAEGTREACARDYRLFFSFLWQRGSECPGNAVGTGVGPGAAAAPTDATAVGVLAKALPRRIVTTLRAESLVNDGT